MICVGENKGIICKGDFHPAQLYKGDKKIAGYTVEDVEGAGSVTLENCYNDKLYDVQINSKNLLDVKKVFPDYVNDEGGITYTNKDFTKIHIVNMMPSNFKDGVAYTLSIKYSLEGESGNSVSAIINYTDGTNTKKYMMVNTTGSCIITSDKSKIIKNILLGFSTASKSCNIKLTNMQLEEGATATENEAPLTEATVTVRGKNILDMSKHTVTQGYYLDSSGNSTSSNERFIKISPIAVKYTISIGSNHYLYTIWYFEGGDNTGITRVNAYNLRTKTFTTPENCNYIRVSIDSIDSGGTAVPSDLEWVMLEKDTGDGNYEPYVKPQIVSFENGALTAEIPTFKGTTIIDVAADVDAHISGKYKKMEE